VRDLRRELKAVQDKNANLQTQAEELRSEVSYVQNLLGESRQRVTHLEELVTSLQRELAVSKEELKIAAAVSHQLQIELDAAQQVPVDSPDLQQLQLRLADMTLDRDQYKDAWNQIFTDLTTIRETTTAETVEAIVEWLQHFRGCNSPSLALLLLEALPHIMRSLTGLADEEIE
jgi:chromosome segregation ATPase